MAKRDVAPWRREANQRIAAGLEFCRHCGTTERLTLAKISHGERTIGNTTILCVRDAPMPSPLQEWRYGLRSLAYEQRTRVA